MINLSILGAISGANSDFGPRHDKIILLIFFKFIQLQINIMINMYFDFLKNYYKNNP